MSVGTPRNMVTKKETNLGREVDVVHSYDYSRASGAALEVVKVAITNLTDGNRPGGEHCFVDPRIEEDSSRFLRWLADRHRLRRQHGCRGCDHLAPNGTSISG